MAKKCKSGSKPGVSPNAYVNPIDKKFIDRSRHLIDLPPDCKPIGCKWVLKKN